MSTHEENAMYAGTEEQTEAEQEQKRSRAGGWTGMAQGILAFGILAVMAGMIWTTHETSDAGQAHDFVSQNEGALRSSAASQAADRMDLTGSPRREMIAGLSSGKLRTRWCGERPGSAFRSRHRILMDCSLELRTKTPVRMTVDAVYWIELDEEQAGPLGKVAAITHGLSEDSFHIETYGTEWPQAALAGQPRPPR